MITVIREPCLRCMGIGTDHIGVVCKNCSGLGVIQGSMETIPSKDACPMCKGLGRAPWTQGDGKKVCKKCRSCLGSGIRPEY